MNKETNKQTAEKLFATTSHDVLFANPKGEFFTTENIGALSLKPGEKLERFERAAKVEKVKETKEFEEVEYEFNAKDTIGKIKNVVALENLKAFENDARKSVKEAYEKKQAELLAAIKVNGAKDSNVNQNDKGNEDTQDQK